MIIKHGELWSVRVIVFPVKIEYWQLLRLNKRQ